MVLRLTLSGVQPLTNGYHYEGWAVIGGQPMPTGKFNVDAAGKLVTLSGAAITNGEFDPGLDLGMVTAIIVTIEPAGDTDAVPAQTHYLAGSVASGSAALSVGAAPALGADFRTAAGKFILATPTDSVTTNEKSGVWFVDLGSGSPAAGLSLPTLPAGWVYEGWTVIGATPVSTGRFTSPSGTDQSAPFSGTSAGPPFPGEDFLMAAPSGLTFPTDLSGQMVVVSIEPEPDDAATPFTLKPLVGAVPALATDHTNYALDNRASGFPNGTATIP